MRHQGDIVEVIHFFFCVHSSVRVCKIELSHRAPSKPIRFGRIIPGHMHERSNSKTDPVNSLDIGWTNPTSGAEPIFITLVYTNQFVN